MKCLLRQAEPQFVPRVSVFKTDQSLTIFRKQNPGGHLMNPSAIMKGFPKSSLHSSVHLDEKRLSAVELKESVTNFPSSIC